MGLVFDFKLYHDCLINSHQEYLRLGKTEDEGQCAYRRLFKGAMPELDLIEIRASLQKEWVLGSERFRQKIERQLGLKRRAHGGDRKSSVFSWGVI